MKKVKEVLEKSTSRVDTKARRRSNTSKKVANITTDQIEEGITIEALEAINVPVYRYGTQMTIHGVLPDFDQDRIGGYKALLKNKNGTVGVKYIAVDGAKKEIIGEANNYADKTRLGFFKNSQGIDLNKCVETPEEALEIYESIPDYIVGNKSVVRDIYGRIWVSVNLSAIYQADLDQFIEWYTYGELKNSDDVITKKVETRERWERERQERKAEFEKQKAEMEAKGKAEVEEMKAKCTPVTDQLGTVEGKFYVLKDTGKVARVTFKLTSDGKMTFERGFKEPTSWGELKFKVRGPKFKSVMDGAVAVYEKDEVESKLKAN